MRLRDFDIELKVPAADFQARHRFRQGTRFVCAHYERCFPGLQTEGVWKIVVECVQVVDEPRMLCFSGVLVIQRLFDIEGFDRAVPDLRHRQALAVLHEGALAVAREQNWPRAPFEAAERCVLDENLVNRWTWPKPRASPDRKLRAFLDCHHESERFRAWLVVTDRYGAEIQRILAFEDRPSEFAFVPNMGKLRWSSSARVALEAKDGHEVAALEVAR